MNNKSDTSDSIDEQRRKQRLQNSLRVKAWRAKMTNEKKEKINQKKREQYRRDICIYEFAASKGITITEVNGLINSK